MPILAENCQIWPILAFFDGFLSIILDVIIRFTSNIFQAPLLLVADSCTSIISCDTIFAMPILAKNCQIWPILAFFDGFLSIILAVIIRFTSNIFQISLLLAADNCAPIIS